MTFYLLSLSIMCLKCIQVVACISFCSILWLNNIPSCVHTTVGLYSSTDEHMDCFDLLTIRDNVYKFLCRHAFSFLLGSILRGGIAGSYGNSLFNLFPPLVY